MSGDAAGVSGNLEHTAAPVALTQYQPRKISEDIAEEKDHACDDRGTERQRRPGQRVCHRPVRFDDEFA